MQTLILDFMHAHWLNLVFLVPLFIAVLFVFRRSLPAPMLAHGRTVFAPPQSNEWHDPLLEQIVDWTFGEREPVVVDGKHFVRCKFRSCDFFYSGGIYEMTDCSLDGTFNFSTDHPAINGALPLLGLMGQRNDGSGLPQKSSIRFADPVAPTA